MRSSRLAIGLAVVACGGTAAASHEVEAPPAEVGPDAQAESLFGGRAGGGQHEKEWWHFSYQVDGAVPFDRVIR
jgi:ABC-type glycerol-3-phosphate transport system substrate-binding protein